jgi:hypothetical protein
MILTYYLTSTNDREVLGDAVTIPLILHVIHRLTVSLKYATLSETEYRKFIECQDEELCSMYVSQMQLLGFWSTRKEILIDFE